MAIKECEYRSECGSYSVNSATGVCVSSSGFCEIREDIIDKKEREARRSPLERGLDARMVGIGGPSL